MFLVSFPVTIGRGDYITKEFVIDYELTKEEFNILKND